ncbi:MAG TPA: hypothetical protein VFC78_12950 [Tepidisphaeraceae bacterium]|nr:hypothetical protein [Tepidisphaeraceae bacterium]
MEQTTDRLNKLFTERFSGALAELEEYPGTQKVGGYLIWDGFEGIEPLDRQRQLSRVLRDGIGGDYRSRVTTILTVTPAEIEVMRT